MNKKVPIVIIFMLLLLIGLLLVFFKDDIKKEENSINKESYLVIDNDTIWSYSDNWNKAYYSDVNNKNMEVYINYSYMGNLTLKYGNTWNLFSNGNYISYVGKLFAISDNFVNLVNFDDFFVDNNDLQVINNLLKLNLNLEDISLSEKISVDLNNDGYKDSVVYASNLNTDGVDSYFNLVYTSINDKVNVLISDTYESSYYYNAPLYEINYIIDINDKKNIILSKGYFSDAGVSGNMMYELIDGKYKLVIED